MLEIPQELKDKKYADVAKDTNGKRWYILSISNGIAKVISEDYQERAILNSGEYTVLHPKGNRMHFHDVEAPKYNY